MNLPQSVKIGPYDYPIEIKQEVRGENNEDLYGYWHAFPRHYIEIKDECPSARTLAIFLHECLHGIDDAWDVGLKEKHIRRLGTGLAAFLQDNNLLNPTLFEPEEG